MNRSTKFRVVELKQLKKSLIEEIINLEKETFGKGGLNKWTLPVFIKYGQVFLLKQRKNTCTADRSNRRVGGVAEFMRSWIPKNYAFMVGFLICKELQGKGWGKYFLTEIITRLKKNQVSHIQLSVSPKNFAGLRLYQDFGFREIAKIDDMYGRDENRLILELNLNHKNILQTD